MKTDEQRDLTLHPELDALRLEEAALQTRLQAVLHALFVLEHDTYRELTDRYNAYFRDQEIRLQTVTLKAAEMQRRVELFVIRTRHGAVPDEREIALVNEMVDREFRTYRERIRDAFELNAQQRDAKSSTATTTEFGRSAEERRRLYRALVKQLHPDTQADPEQFDKFWILVSDAYERRDLARLRVLHNLICETHTLSELSSSGEDLVSVHEHVKRLRMKCEYEERKLQRLQSQEPYSLASMLDDDRARQQHAAHLDEQINKQERISAAAANQLTVLLGRPWEEFLKTDPATQQAFDFQDDFIQNTYFSMRA